MKASEIMVKKELEKLREQVKAHDNALEKLNKINEEVDNMSGFYGSRKKKLKSIIKE